MRFLLALIPIMLAFSNIGRAAEPLWKKVGGWEIRVDRSLGYGCFMFAEYQTTIFRIGLNRENNTGYIVLGDINWRSLEVGKQYKIEMQFADAGPWSGDATAFKFSPNNSMTFLILKFSDPKIIQQLMQKQDVTFRYRGRQLAVLSLRGSFAATEELFKCQEAMERAGLSGHTPSRDPFANRSAPAPRDPFSY